MRASCCCPAAPWTLMLLASALLRLLCCSCGEPDCPGALPYSCCCVHPSQASPRQCRCSPGGMDHSPGLNVGHRPHGDVVEVSSEHHVVPDADLHAQQSPSISCWRLARLRLLQTRCCKIAYPVQQVYVSDNDRIGGHPCPHRHVGHTMAKGDDRTLAHVPFVFYVYVGRCRCRCRAATAH